MRCCKVDIGRCACIHGRFQATDAILQCILYQRAVVPAPVNQILNFAETSQELKFVQNYSKVREALKEVFRSHNRNLLRQVVILIGNSCFLPKELYLIQVNLCGTQDPEHCHHDCSELTDKELRKVSSTLLFDVFGNDFDLPNLQAQWVHLFILASPSLRFPAELIEEDEGFELPSESVILRKKIKSFRIMLKHHCGMYVNEDPEEDCSGLTWFRVSSCLRKFAA